MKINKILKLLILISVGVILLIFSGIGIKKICLNTTKAESNHYIQTLNPTTLYSDNALTCPLIEIPTGYYGKIISSTDTIAKISYNDINGFIKLDQNTEIITTTPTRSLYETAEMTTSSDAGTHLRQEPNTTSEKVTLIPPNSKLEYIGKISGITPSDGTSKIWYYVHYNSGETTTHTGYVYSERVNITSGMEEREPVASTQTSTTPITNENQEIKPETTLSQTPTISSGLKIFLIILFATLAIIIFALLLISPKKAIKNTKTTAKIIPDRSTDEIQDKRNQEFESHDPKPSKIPAYNQPEFGEFVDFTQNKNNSKPIQNFSRPSKNFSHKRELNFKHKPSSSSSLPPALSRYFTITHSDDEI